MTYIMHIRGFKYWQPTRLSLSFDNILAAVGNIHELSRESRRKEGIGGIF